MPFDLSLTIPQAAVGNAKEFVLLLATDFGLAGDLLVEKVAIAVKFGLSLRTGVVIRD